MKTTKTGPLFFLLLSTSACGWLFPKTKTVATERTLPSQGELIEHCEKVVGKPRVDQVKKNIFVAIGFDLANTIVVHTDAGNVIIDTGSSPTRAKEAKEALMLDAPGPTAAIIYTHSHIDHVGGASVWAEEKTPIWATDSFEKNFFNQYGLYRKAETRRGAAQFGMSASTLELPCSSLGKKLDVTEASQTGVRMPTQTFTDKTSFQVGQFHFELYAAPGETQDHLFVWVPELQALFVGDNYYRAFPNLYTIRGSSPRPVDTWINSLDRMRAFSADVMIPSHTLPVYGAETVAKTLTNYRDAIQWVRDRVIQAANNGDSIETIIANIGLPKHLAADFSLKELYGQIDWSARAIYDANLGWFQEKPEDLYPLSPKEHAQRSIALMGGVAKVEEAAASSLDENPRWALELLALVRDSELVSKDQRDAFNQQYSDTLRRVAAEVANTNGRAYLLEAAKIAIKKNKELPTPSPDEVLVEAIPISFLFQVMQTRLLPEKSTDAFESVVFEIDKEKYIMTIRYGVAELAIGEPLPGTPKPIATIHADANTWRRIALGLLQPADALTSDKLKIDGDKSQFYRFSERFQQGI
jgi:alkyl sulfatase BDS1-like metallo-beta-lactamase superfamily hydrolase